MFAIIAAPVGLVVRAVAQRIVAFFLRKAWGALAGFVRGALGGGRSEVRVRPPEIKIGDVRWRRNPAFVAQIKRQPEFQRALLHAAEEVARKAQMLAPSRTGAYRRSIAVVSVGDRIFVASADPFAHLVEFGSANNPPYAPLRRGARAAGLRLGDAPDEE